MIKNFSITLLLLLIVSCKQVQKPTFVTFSNSQIHYKVIGEGDKNLVFIHGWGCDMNAWKNQVDYFADRFTVVLIDLPGFGKSSKENESYNMEFFAAAVKAVLDRLGINEPILVGHSLGHPIARQLIKKYTTLKPKLCIVDGVYFNFPTDSLEKETYKKDLAGFVDLFSGDNQKENTEAFINSLFISSTPQHVKTYTDTTMKKVPEHVGFNTMRHLIEEEYWHHHPLHIPTMAVYANIPELPDDNETVLRRWYPNLSYHELDRVGHFLMMESPKEFNVLLYNFVK